MTKEEIIKRITQLEIFLNNSDYAVLPDYDKPNDDIKVQRQLWRDEIRKLEKNLK